MRIIGDVITMVNVGSKAKIGGGWNYTRYQVIKYYGSNGSILW